MHALNPHILTILHSFFSIQTYTDRISLFVFNETIQGNGRTRAIFATKRLLSKVMWLPTGKRLMILSFFKFGHSKLDDTNFDAEYSNESCSLFSAFHRWSHVSEKPLSCDRCSMTFTSKAQFAVHIRTHSAGQNYECNICGRTFIRDSYLIR